jgi:hypothetical protein
MAREPSGTRRAKVAGSLAMSFNLKDFDLRCRGAFKIAEDWMNSSLLRKVWTIEDVVRLYCELLCIAVSVYDDYCKTGKSTDISSRGIVLYHLRELSIRGSALLRIIGPNDSERFVVAGVVELRSNLSLAIETLREEEYATDMSLLNFKES